MDKYRFLLDQNFPAPVLDIAAADRSVEYIALRHFDVSLTVKDTPDWLIYLSAADAGFTGVVTRDASQLDDAEEVVALSYLQLSVVTWDVAIEDPITEWGQLLAYMPMVRKTITRDGHRFFTLPRPRLDRRNHKPAREVIGEMASREKRSMPEIRDEARSLMRSELTRRGLEHLAALLERPAAPPPP